MEYLRFKRDNVVFRCYSVNTLDPEIIEINPPMKRCIEVFSDNFFTRLVCGYLTGDSSNSTMEIPGLEEYIQQLDWSQRWYYHYMKTRARMEFWAERELFKRIATFVDQKS